MTVKEYNEWRKEFGRVQVLLYAFPNVLKKIGNEDLIKELKILGYDEHTLDFLNSAMDAFEKAEKERKEAEANALKDKQLTDNILEAIGDKEFVNDFTKKSIIAQIKEELGKQENAGKGIKDIFEGLTKDSTDIFKNPQQQKLNINPTNNGGADDKIKSFKDALRDKYRQ